MATGTHNRLVGYMPEVMFKNPLEYIKDGIIDAFEEIGEKIAGAMNDWATWGSETAIKILSNKLLPDVKLFFEGPVSIIFGANYGLSLMILRSLIVVAVLVTAIAAFRQRRTEFAGRVLSSFMYLFIFSVLFLPVYTFVLSVVRKVGEVVLENAASVSGGSMDSLPGALSSSLTAQPLAIQFLAGLMNGAWSTILVLELSAMVVMGVLLVIFYPLSFALKPFGKFGLNQFRYASAAVLTIPISLLIMIGIVGLELVMIRSAASAAPFLGGLAGLVISSVFGLLIVLIPFVIFGLAYSQVVDFVGNSDVKIQSAVDIATMPDVNSRDITNENNRERLRYVREFASELPAAVAAGENSPGTEAKELAKQIAIKAAMSSTNPVIAGGTAAYTAYKVVEKVVESRNDRGGGSNE